jgi:hypothetical protein
MFRSGRLRNGSDTRSDAVLRAFCHRIGAPLVCLPRQITEELELKVTGYPPELVLSSTKGGHDGASESHRLLPAV